ncbi:hypothetical protein PIGHUM_03082 [Pigmentiphaga humi]|uniref:DUF1640 domain-containing protein n=1 Tax=Pigmentiphaga humi TaxID=2478468 RepID=A0A3P4B4L4_9BURK|nr:hypothetical protein [Pigmentiphaga humi]VCU71002.1 hypothetical protein PIGHUM_03082 [Pigmentiphaga humi]
MPAVPYALDTLKVTERLEESGFTREQAKAQAQVLAEIVQLDNLGGVTQEDLRQAVQQLEGRMDRLGADLNLLRWMTGSLIAGVVAILARLFLVVPG